MVLDLSTEEDIKQCEVIEVPRLIIHKSSYNGWVQITEQEREDLFKMYAKDVDGNQLEWYMEHSMVLLAIQLKSAIKINRFGSDIAYKTSMPAPDTLMTVSLIDEYTDEHINTFWYDTMLDDNMQPVPLKEYNRYVSSFQKTGGILNGRWVNTLHVLNGGVEPTIINKGV